MNLVKQESVFRSRVRKLLSERGMQRKDLAPMINIPLEHLNSYLEEYARPPLRVLNDIADVFGVSVDYLLGEEVSEDDLKIHIIQRAYMMSSGKNKKYIMGMVKMILEEIEGVDAPEQGGQE